MSEILVHGTAVALDGRAVLLRGPSGSGKSDLALRLIDAGATLVADDQTRVWRDGGSLLIGAPATIAGLVEVRGVGILRVAVHDIARLCLIADLVAPDRIERLPEPATEAFFGVAVPCLLVAPFEASAAVKLRLALAAVEGDGAVAEFHR